SEPDTDEARVRRAGAMKAVKAEGSASYAEGYVRQMFAPRSFTENPAAVETIRSIIAGTPPLSIAGTLLALAARTDTTRSLGAVNIPALIMVGDQDTVTPLASARALHEGIKGSELHVVPGAAHMSNMENPAFFNEKLLAFLGRLPRTN
ncbi:MAG TPA: alpha/beta hydrolase, partial [Bacteroidota bacterium]|nr:alpha/beta hydrolase [Bacteroidota bacterium]